MDWRGNSEKSLNWGDGGWRVIKEFLLKQIMRGWVEGIVEGREEDLEGITTPAHTPIKNFNCTQGS